MKFLQGADGGFATLAPPVTKTHCAKRVNKSRIIKKKKKKNNDETTNQVNHIKISACTIYKSHENPEISEWPFHKQRDTLLLGFFILICLVKCYDRCQHVSCNINIL